MKRLADRRQRRLRRVGFWVVVAAIGGYLFFVGDHRPHHLLMLWLEERRAEERIATLEAERRDLAAEEVRLASDSLALEALAREKGLVRPGDLVYRIVPVPPDVREAAAESLAARAARIAADSMAAVREVEARRGARPSGAVDPVTRDGPAEAPSTHEPAAGTDPPPEPGATDRASDGSEPAAGRTDPQPPPAEPPSG